MRSILVRRYIFSLLILFLLLGYSSLGAQAQIAPVNQPVYSTEVKVSQQPMDSSIAEDAEVNKLLMPYLAATQSKMGAVLGVAREVLSKGGEGVEGYQYNGIASGRLGLWVADIIRIQAALVGKRRIDLAIQNNHGLRLDEIPAGQITVDTVYQLMPFENEVAIIELSGADLLKLFESFAEAKRYTNAAISGAELVYCNNRLVSAKLGCNPIDANATYTIALTDYLYKGGGEFPILQQGKNYQSTGLLLRDAIINYIKSQTTLGYKIAAPANARIIWLQSKAADCN